MNEGSFSLSYGGGKHSVSINIEGHKKDPNHKYYAYLDKAPVGFISYAARLLVQHYLPGIQQSLAKWRKDNNTYIHQWSYDSGKTNHISNPFNYLIFAEELRTHSGFDYDKFSLPPIESDWLDSTIDIASNLHFVDKNGETFAINDGSLAVQYGPNFPIKSIIDREGVIFSTFQPQLAQRIIKLRKRLIEDSKNALTADWIFDLRGLINDTISLVDITLMQLYNKAEYFPKEGWKFDIDKLGQKNGRRIKDKLKWVRLVSGNSLDIEVEYGKLDSLRKLRNHLIHFDPPTLAITLEEVADWLNDILYIGVLLVKIRTAINEPASVQLINLISQKMVRFNPENAFINRVPLNRDAFGYNTSTWKDVK